VLKVWSRRRRDLASTRTQVVCRLHAVLCELVPSGVVKKVIAAHAVRLLDTITPPDAVAAARWELATLTASPPGLPWTPGRYRAEAA